jgi:hypothetical protein
MAKSKKEAPKSEAQDENELTQEQLEQAAGGIIVQGGLTLSQPIMKAPTVSAPPLPGINDLAL